jgi:hypothetical protein
MSMGVVDFNYNLKIVGNTSTLINCVQACDPQIVSHNMFNIIIVMPVPICVCHIHNKYYKWIEEPLNGFMYWRLWMAIE